MILICSHCKGLLEKPKRMANQFGNTCLKCRRKKSATYSRIKYIKQLIREEVARAIGELGNKK